jgi:hypothetical protein
MVNLARVSWLVAAVLLTAGPVAGESRQEVQPTICSADHGLQLALSAKAFLARTLLQVQLAPTQLAAFESFRAVFEGEVDKVRSICTDAKLRAPTEELEIVLQQIDASLNAILVTKSAAGAFYATLSAEQKSQLGPYEPWFVLASLIWSGWALGTRSGRPADVQRWGAPRPLSQDECAASGCVCIAGNCYALPPSTLEEWGWQRRWRDQKDFGKLWTE